MSITIVLMYKCIINIIIFKIVKKYIFYLHPNYSNWHIYFFWNREDSYSLKTCHNAGKRLYSNDLKLVSFLNNYFSFKNFCYFRKLKFKFVKTFKKWEWKKCVMCLTTRPYVYLVLSWQWMNKVKGRIQTNNLESSPTCL